MDRERDEEAIFWVRARASLDRSPPTYKRPNIRRDLAEIRADRVRLYALRAKNGLDIYSAEPLPSADIAEALAMGIVSPEVAERRGLPRG